MVPRMQMVAAPLTQTVPSGSAVTSMLAARPTLLPWETRYDAGAAPVDVSH